MASKGVRRWCVQLEVKQARSCCLWEYRYSAIDELLLHCESLAMLFCYGGGEQLSKYC